MGEAGQCCLMSSRDKVGMITPKEPQGWRGKQQGSALVIMGSLSMKWMGCLQDAA